MRRSRSNKDLKSIKPTTASRKRTAQTYAIVLMFMAAPLLLLGVFTFYPLIKGIILSFSKYNIITGKSQWIGLKNYKFVLSDSYFYKSLWNTLEYLLVVPPIQFMALLVAVLVNQKIPGIKFFRTIFYIPVISGAVIVSMMWNWIYAENGLLNAFLKNLHLINDPVLWITDKHIALISCMFITFWRGIGYYMVIYLAGLQTIPYDLYEASMLDGASSSKRFFKITLPLMRPSILLCTVLSSMGALGVFEEIYLLTQGKYGTSTLAYEVYNQAFKQFQFGRSSAIAVLLSIIISVFTILNFKFFGSSNVGDKK